MEIKKADSKGRVTGFEPGEYYSVVRGHTGTGFALNRLRPAPTDTPIRDAVKAITGTTDEELERFGGLGSAEEAEMLLNQKMTEKNANDRVQ